MISVLAEETLESPYVEKVTHGYSLACGSIMRPAETNCHLVISKRPAKTEVFFVGPINLASRLEYGADAEMIWIRLRLGTRLADTPTVKFANNETALPKGSDSKIEIGECCLPIPEYRDIDLFVEKLARSRLFQFDPIVTESLAGAEIPMAPRTLRQSFLKGAGISREQILQIQRAHQAKALLHTGVSMADVAYQLGYYDQPHMVRNLRKYIGHTPGSLAR